MTLFPPGQLGCDSVNAYVIEYYKLICFKLIKLKHFFKTYFIISIKVHHEKKPFYSLFEYINDNVNTLILLIKSYLY